MSEAFAPLPDVDLVWHLHLTSTEQYQRDVLAYPRQGTLLRKEGKSSVQPFVVPHCPILNDTKEGYEGTLKRIQEKGLEKIVGKKANMAYWPPFPRDKPGCGGGG